MASASGRWSRKTVAWESTCHLPAGNAYVTADPLVMRCMMLRQHPSIRTAFLPALLLGIGLLATPSRAEQASFRQDVVPILTKAGCNSGGCHGKLSGQNGFKLSLRGYAPEWDFDSIVTEIGSRRVDLADPGSS